MYITNMKAPSDKRPTWRNGVIQIHITRACDLSCIGCTQGSNLGGKPTVMTYDNFEQAVYSLRDYNGVIGIFGGNPTLHPSFEEFCYLLKSYIPYERRGLWSNNLNGYGGLCRDIFNPGVSNLNVHMDQSKYDEMKRDWPECNPIGLEYDSRHSPPFVALKDIKDISEDDKWHLINNCDINQLWSAMVCQFRGQLRGFFCELAGAQSMLHENEPDYPDTGIDVKRDENWWKYPIEVYKKQIEKHCMECGIPLRGAGDLAVTGILETVSKTHLNIYKLKKPAGKRLKVVSSFGEMGNTVKRATDYIANGVPVNNQQKVMIAVPTAEGSRYAFFYSHLASIDKPENTIQLMSNGQSPARNRNIAIREAIHHDCSHILFLDDDVIVQPDVLKRLLAHDKDIVTGLYMMRNFPHKPIVFSYSNDKGECAWMDISGKRGLIEIVNTGLGLALIKVDVFKKMVEMGKTFKNGDKDCWIVLGELEKDHWCDDIGFFNRARECGYKLYCDLDVVGSHMSTVKITPVIQDGQWHVEYDTNGTGHVRFPFVIEQPQVQDPKDLADTLHDMTTKPPKEAVNA